MSEWASEVLGSLCDFCAGSAFPKSAQGLSTGDYPFIKVSDMNSGGNERCITESNNWVSESERRRIKAKLHPAGAVAFAKIGVALTFNRRRILGRPTIIDNNMMSAVPRESAVDRAFFYYLLRTVDFNTIAAGTALPYLNVSDLRQMPVQIPPLPTQRLIAHILGTLDDKIELNRRMNRTLEKTAAALFKSWFIDFDPVHAKADGRDLGIPAEIADLFPDTFEDSDLGPIPKGWKVGRLDDLLVLQRGFDLPVGQRKRGSVPVVMASGIGDYQNEYKASGPGVVTGRSGKLGDVFLIPDNFWPLNTTLWVKEYRETRPCHAYLLLKELALSSYNAGSAVPTLNRNHIHNVKVILPPSDIVDAYEHLAMSFYRKCWANEE